MTSGMGYGRADKPPKMMNQATSKKAKKKLKKAKQKGKR